MDPQPRRCNRVGTRLQTRGHGPTGLAVTVEGTRQEPAVQPYLPSRSCSHVRSGPAKSFHRSNARLPFRASRARIRVRSNTISLVRLRAFARGFEREEGCAVLERCVPVGILYELQLRAVLLSPRVLLRLERSVYRPELRHARSALIDAGLIAFEPPLYQVLSLDDAPPTPAQRRSPAPRRLSEVLQQIVSAYSGAK